MEEKGYIFGSARWFLSAARRELERSFADGSY